MEMKTIMHPRPLRLCAIAVQILIFWPSKIATNLFFTKVPG
jgi:hypothetical protein